MNENKIKTEDRIRRVTRGKEMRNQIKSKGRERAKAKINENKIKSQNNAI